MEQVSRCYSSDAGFLGYRHACGCFSGQENDDRQIRYYYTGILGDGIGIQMELVMDSSGVTGSYIR
ncbi:MAG: hypothetical protein R3B51_13645 [Thermodesulfobacteriota bacterium]